MTIRIRNDMDRRSESIRIDQNRSDVDRLSTETLSWILSGTYSIL